MNVFLAPLSGDRYILYGEEPVVGPTPPTGAKSWKERLKNVFARMLAEGEQIDRTGHLPDLPAGARIRRAVLRRIAAAVAEQRLLWQLRRATGARLVHPDDMTSSEAIAASGAWLATERRRRLRWAVVDGLLALGCLPLALVPGPNVLGYYFLFRAVGHYLSWQGAGRGLGAFTWTPAPIPALTAIRAALTLDPDSRAPRVAELGATLGLLRLASFLEAELARIS